MGGQSYLCPEVSRLVLNGYQGLLAEKSTAARPALTAREPEVLKLTAQGLRIKDIANQLDIAAKTVETHRSNLMYKIAVQEQRRTDPLCHPRRNISHLTPASVRP